MQRVVPILFDLRNTCLKSRHWEVIHEMVQWRFSVRDPNFTAGTLIEMDIFQCMIPASSST
jgi:hypothetical protein